MHIIVRCTLQIDVQLICLLAERMFFGLHEAGKAVDMFKIVLSLFRLQRYAAFGMFGMFYSCSRLVALLPAAVVHHDLMESVMNIANCSVVVFSPTGSSRKVALAVARGCANGDAEVLDATCHSVDERSFGAADLVIAAVPVYGGKVAPLALKRLSGIKGSSTPVVPIVVYGNRAYDGALKEWADFLSQRGFVPIAAGAFVGEHSYSTEAYPIATGRPDVADLEQAEALGRAVKKKIEQNQNPSRVDVRLLKHPRSSFGAMLRFVFFVLRMRRKLPQANSVPTVSADKCVGCGLCVSLCPAEAIVRGDELHTDASRCIRCCACVKGCATNARTYSSPFAPILSECFGKRKNPVVIV